MQRIGERGEKVRDDSPDASMLNDDKSEGIDPEDADLVSKITDKGSQKLAVFLLDKLC